MSDIIDDDIAIFTPVENGSVPPSIPPVITATPTWRQSGGAGMYSYAVTDAPSNQHYYTGDLPERTGYSLDRTYALELIGVHPSSACHHVWGRFWLRSEIDGWLNHLEEPGVREWVDSFLLPAPADQPPPLTVPGAFPTPPPSEEKL